MPAGAFDWNTCLVSTADVARPNWLIDELAHAGRENIDPDHVLMYDDKEDADAQAEIELLVHHGLNAGSTLIDLGAGTGQLTLAAVRTGASVIAVDVSPVMLERLRAKAKAAKPPNLRIVEGGFLTYDHEGPPADIVYSRWALHHLADFWKALALSRIRSMLRTGGLLRLSDIVYSFDPAETHERIDQWRKTVPIAAGPGVWVRADIDDHVRDEHSTFTWLLEPMIERSQFRIEQAEYSADGYFAEYIARAI